MSPVIYHEGASLGGVPIRMKSDLHFKIVRYSL